MINKNNLIAKLRLTGFAFSGIRSNIQNKAILTGVMHHGTAPTRLLLNKSISLSRSGKRSLSQHLNPNLIILQVKANNKVINLLLHCFLKQSCVLRIDNRKALVIIKFPPQATQLNMVLNKRSILSI